MAEFILILTVVARNSSYLFMKMSVDCIPPLTLVAVRFLLAFAFLSLLFWKKMLLINKETLAAGSQIGVLMFLILAFQMYGIETVSSSEAGFLAASTVIFVPIINCFCYGKKQDISLIFSVLITFFGIFLLSFTTDFVLSKGAVFYIIAAVIYAVHIIMTERFSKKVNLLSAGIIEMGVTGLLSLIFAYFTEDFSASFSPKSWGIILGLVFICSVVGLAVQPRFQKYTSSERYGLFCGMGPLFSAILGIVFLHECMNFQEIIGSVLILAGVFLGTNYRRKDKSRD